MYVRNDVFRFRGTLALQADGDHVSENLSDPKTKLIVRIDSTDAMVGHVSIMIRC